MSAPAGPVPRSSAAEAMHEEEALGKAYDARLLSRLWQYVRPYRAQVLLTLALVFPLFTLELAPAWIVKRGLDRVIVPLVAAVEAPAAGVEAPAGAAERLDFLFDPPAAIPPLVWLAALYLLATTTSAALQFLNMWLMSRTGQSAMRDLRSAVFRHVQTLHLGFFDRYPVGRLVTRATNDVENVAEMFSAGIVALVTDVLKMVGFAVVLFGIDARLALVTFLVVPFLAVAAVVFRFKVRQAFRLVRVRIARINAYLQENVTGMREVQLFRREERNFSDFDAMNAAHRDAWFQSIRYDAALFAVVEFASRVTVAIIVWHATGIAEAGTLYVFIDYMRRFFMPLRDLSAKYSVMQSSMASAERIFQLFDTEPAVVDRTPQASVVPTVHAVPRRRLGEVRFEHVSFAYPQGERVLEDVSFRVAPGEKVAFVGATGAGKTTVIKLLARLYDVTDGRIRIDGVDLRELPQRELRRRVALVLQDVFLFSGTIEENISLGRPEIDRATVEQVAKAVDAHAFIERLPRGYDTVLRERGTNFSTGQRQLLSFARALAHGADILVLDEATSSIDPETEALVQRGIHALMERKTALVIAHRLSTIQDVDRIYVIHRGRIAESGSHDELLAADGIYRRLHRLQYLGREPDTAAAAG